MFELLRVVDHIARSLDSRGLLQPLPPARGPLETEQRIRDHEARFLKDHAPALRRDYEAERWQRAGIRVRVLAELAEDRHTSHEARAVATALLEEARREQLALRAGEAPPAARSAQTEEARRRHLFGIVRPGVF